MQRTNKPAHAPVGTALFLFLGLAILPVSLRATGFEFGFSPRLSAATDAWQQVAEVFGASYRPVPLSALNVVKDLDMESSNAIESSETAGNRCAHKTEERPEPALRVADARSSNDTPIHRAASKPASLRGISRVHVPTIIATDAAKSGFEKQATTSELGAMKVATLKRAELFKSIDKHLFNFTFTPIEIRNPSGQKKVQVLVQMRKAVAGSSSKGAERKVFAALASARRRECDRAALTGMTTESPDRSEF